MLAYYKNRGKKGEKNTQTPLQQGFLLAQFWSQAGTAERQQEHQSPSRLALVHPSLRASSLPAEPGSSLPALGLRRAQGWLERSRQGQEGFPASPSEPHCCTAPLQLTQHPALAGLQAGALQPDGCRLLCGVQHRGPPRVPTFSILFPQLPQAKGCRTGSSSCTHQPERYVGVLSSKPPPNSLPAAAAAQQPAGLTSARALQRHPRAPFAQGPGAQQSSGGPGEPGTALEGAKQSSLKRSRLKTETTSNFRVLGELSQSRTDAAWEEAPHHDGDAHFFSRKGLKSPQSNASMAWGLGRSLGFLKLSFSVRRVLSTSTGSVLPVNFCKGSSVTRRKGL